MSENKEGPTNPGRRRLLGGLIGLAASVITGGGIGKLIGESVKGQTPTIKPDLTPVPAPPPGEIQPSPMPSSIPTPFPQEQLNPVPTPVPNEQIVPVPTPDLNPTPIPIPVTPEGQLVIDINPLNLPLIFDHSAVNYTFYSIIILALILVWSKRNISSLKSIV